ncbi:unnamed protein product [Hapterophycus canaliculatus]
MSLQGSIHTWSDGIGYGAFIPTDRAYFNASSGRSLPSSDKLREYRRSNVTAGIDTHRSDVSFGKTTESVRCGLDGDSRAREATKSLTSGEVGGFHWPKERSRDGDVETILATASATASNASAGELHPVSTSAKETSKNSPPMRMSARHMKEHERMAEMKVVSSRNQRPSRAPLSPHSGSGCSTRRSESTCAPSSYLSSDSSTNSSRFLSSRSSARSSREEPQPNVGRRTRRPPSYDKLNPVGISGGSSSSNDGGHQQLSHRTRGSTSGNRSSRSNGKNNNAQENRLRPQTLLDLGAPALTSAPKHTQLRTLDPVFDRHRKYDLIAEERAAEGSQVTGRFGPVHGDSVLAASLLTSELSTPWSHVLRGQKW